MHKHAQITLFMILGVSLLLLIVLVYLFMPLTVNQEQVQDSIGTDQVLTGEAEALQLAISTCMEEKLREAISASGNNTAKIESYLKIQGAKCFKTSGNIQVSYEPPLHVSLSNSLLTANLRTIVSLGTVKQVIETYTIQVTPEMMDSINTTDVQIGEDNFGLKVERYGENAPLYTVGEIIVEYNQTPPQDYDAFVEELGILSRENFFGDDIVFPDSEIGEILKEFANTEVLYFNESEKPYLELQSKLLQQHFIKKVYRNSIMPLNQEEASPLPEIFRQVETPKNDYLYALQWSLFNWGLFFGKQGADINIIPAWDITTGSKDVIIAVIDQGVAANPDIFASMRPTRNFDFLDDDIDITPNGFAEHHGTHVAGIITSQIDNQFGIAGVCPDCSLISMRITNESGLLTTKILARAVAKAVTQGAKIVSMSLGTPQYSQQLDSFFTKLSEAGILFVASAGNAGTTARTYPGAYTGVISVGASTNTDERARFSNYGSWVDIYAPGELIISSCSDKYYCFSSGTSMAAPFVAGTAGLLKSVDPRLSPQGVELVLKRTADQINDINRLNAGEAVKAVAR